MSEKITRNADFFTDIVGHKVYVGDYVAYGVGRGELRLAKVLVIKKSSWEDYSGRERVDISISTAGVRSNWREPGTPEPLSRKGTFFSPETCIRLPEDALPDTWKDALEELCK